MHFRRDGSLESDTDRAINLACLKPMSLRSNIYLIAEGNVALVMQSLRRLLREWYLREEEYANVVNGSGAPSHPQCRALPVPESNCHPE
jgi:hypothetical protein